MSAPTVTALPIPWRPIVAGVARANGTTIHEILSASRVRHVSKARHAAWHAIHVRFGTRPHYIARRFGRDHSSVDYGIRIHSMRLAGIDGQAW